MPGDLRPSPRLIVMTRLPRPGRAKTRLIPALGASGAAGLQRRLTERLLARARLLALERPVALEVAVADGAPEQVAAWLGPGPSYVAQPAGDLGDRMHGLLAHALNQGAPAALVVGCDIPHLDQAILAQALDALERDDLVLGPAADGGYYLLGLKAPQPELFRDMPWGTEQVAALTLARAAGLGLAVSRLPPLSDLDTPEDLSLWREVRAAERETVSVVIPTLNEAAALPATLAAVGAERPHQVLVADGGSHDGTPELARAAGALVIPATGGRAGQMNVAARLATGGIILFLHADTLPPAGWLAEIRRRLAAPGVVAGAFAFGLDQPGAWYRLLERGVSLRCRLLGLPYGDQGLFLPTEVFRELGGFPDLPIMEDVELVRRLQRRGRLALSPLPALTSGRRWRRLGPVRVTMLNILIPLLFYLGFPARSLRRLYDRAG